MAAAALSNRTSGFDKKDFTIPMTPTIAQLPVSFSLDSQTVKFFMPHRDAMALLDGVEECRLAEGRLVGFKNVARNDPALAGHFPDDPIFPGSLIVEALAQAAGCLMNFLYLAERGTPVDRLVDEEFAKTVTPPPLSVLAESRVKQTGLVRPGDKVMLHIRVTLRRGDLSAFGVEAITANGSVAHGDMILGYPAYVPGLLAAAGEGKHHGTH
jgi:3-hydroxyacyl-[acyl-carrier-protein] dehydratase